MQPVRNQNIRGTVCPIYTHYITARFQARFCSSRIENICLHWYAFSIHHDTCHGTCNLFLFCTVTPCLIIFDLFLYVRLIFHNIRRTSCYNESEFDIKSCSKKYDVRSSPKPASLHHMSYKTLYHVLPGFYHILYRCRLLGVCHALPCTGMDRHNSEKQIFHTACNQS